MAAIPVEAAFAPISELAGNLRAGEFTAVELADFFLERLERLGPKLNAVVMVTRDLALEQAARADELLKAGHDLGPLHGIPCGVKDLLAMPGMPVSWGAAPFQDRVIDTEATVITRLREAGAVLCARLAMVEIAGGLGYRQANASFTGPGLNPWDTGRWAGGSSSGPGSAVGAGLVPFAIGSETWGSIMTPAGFCAVSGLRPTYGRISRHGAMALSWTMDKLGPMCRTADDCGLVLAALAGADPDDPSCIAEDWTWPPRDTAPERFQLAVLKDVDEKIQPEVRDNYRASLDVLRGFATLTEIELPDLPWTVVPSTIINCESAAAFEGLVTTGDIWEMTAEEDHWGLHSSLVIPAKDYINALRIRTKLQRALDETLAPFDAVVTPTLPTVAYPNDRQWTEYRAGASSAPLTDLGGGGNACGVPAISVPNGFGEGGLPTGLQFVSRAFAETRLLQIATRYQQHTDWHTRRPEFAST